MVKPSQIPTERLPALQNAYDQLCTYVDFGATKYDVRRILDGPQVRPYFKEYRKDFLEPARSRPAPVDYEDLYRFLRAGERASCFTRPQYTAPMDARDKGNWSEIDHAARFIVRVLKNSWDTDGLWDSLGYDPEDEDNVFECEVYQVWAVLQFLQAEWEAVNRPDWEIDRLNAEFLELMPESTPRL
ncbi:hypothetical protein GGR57DRAFT_497473 [Xylariaceae sp. FL1272]|nr:hypothetical protein GGR57DRAFT_497473 [Xylariaceae sp. FL1272]